VLRDTVVAPRSAPTRIPPHLQRTSEKRLHAAVLLAWFLAAGLYSTATFSRFDRRFFAAPIGNDVWFEADMPIVADTIEHRWSEHHARHAHHPLFALATTVPAYGLRAIGLSERSRLALIVAVSAGLWSATVFALIRLVTPTLFEACVFTLLAHVSAGAMFWLPTIETVVLGSTSLLAPLVLLASDARRRFGDRWYVAASAVSLAMTTTAWMAGVVATASVRRPRAALQITVNALATVVMLWGVQKTLVPPSQFFIETAQHSRFLFSEAAGGPLPRVRSLLLHSMVMPEVQTVRDAKWGMVMSVQRAQAGSSGVVGGVATVLWVALLAAGLWSLWQMPTPPVLRGVLLVTLVGQCAVYLSYGEETFLYALYVTPLLVVCAAIATTTSQRRLVTAVAVVLIALLAVNNSRAFSAAADFFDRTTRADAAAL